MTPFAHFDAVWVRCAQLSALQAYLAQNVAGVLRPEEILRAEWSARVSALDLYVHELVAQQMRAIFDGQRPACAGYLRFQLSLDTVLRIRTAASQSDASAAFDLEVREQLSYLTFQHPEKIADAIRLFSPIEMWNEVAIKFGATATNQNVEAKRLKQALSLIVRRRNQIAHEGDLQPTQLGEPWPIMQSDLSFVATFIENLVQAIDAVV
jgi:hypothetical protein